jgi:hypothetical protein
VNLNMIKTKRATETTARLSRTIQKPAIEPLTRRSDPLQSSATRAGRRLPCPTRS